MLLRAIFNNKNYEEAIQQNGFVAISDFIDSKKNNSLLELYREHHPVIDPAKGMWNSLYDVGPAVAANISNTILKSIEPELTALLENYAAPVASFMSKNPNELGICELHRDFSILDENKFEYRNLWIPLVDITLNNGALYALAGSHRQFNYPLPMFCKWPYIHLQEELFKQVDVFTVKAGSLVVYSDRTLHGSYLNHSNTSRPVIHLGALPVNYELAYYYLGDDNYVKVFQVPYSFFFENKFGDQTGKYPLLHTFLYQPPAVTLPLPAK